MKIYIIHYYHLGTHLDRVADSAQGKTSRSQGVRLQSPDNVQINKRVGKEIKLITSRLRTGCYSELAGFVGEVSKLNI